MASAGFGELSLEINTLKEWFKDQPDISLLRDIDEVVTHELAHLLETKRFPHTKW